MLTWLRDELVSFPFLKTLMFKIGLERVGGSNLRESKRDVQMLGVVQSRCRGETGPDGSFEHLLVQPLPEVQKKT